MMNYKFIGWNNRDGADKVWGVIYIEDRTNKGFPDYSISSFGVVYSSMRPKVLIFWGRRGKKLQTKIDREGWDLDKLIREKSEKGYKIIGNYELETVYPEFQNDLEKTTMWALLKL